jgi:nitroreductase
VSPNELLEFMRQRRSVRRFTDQPVADEAVNLLVTAATTAPSASNKQPWRFLAVTDPDRIRRMADAVREATARIAAHVEPDCRASFEAYGDYFTRFESAPLVLIVLHRKLTLLSNLVDQALPPADRAAIEAMERDSGLMGAAMALDQLLLMAHALGLGASGMTGPLVAGGALRAALDLQPSWEIAALAPVGWPDEAPPPTNRKPAAAVLRWLDRDPLPEDAP